MRQNVIIEAVPEDLVHKLTKEKTGDSMQVGLNIKIKRIGRGYHWTTWWEETGNRKKITKGGTLQSNHSRNVYKVRGGNRIKAEGHDIQ